MRNAPALVLAACLLLAGARCDERSPAGLPVVQVKLGGRTFALEVARTPPEQATGLMRRDSLPADHGMIFVFPDEQVRHFWMKDTRIPLDIIFLDSAGKVVSVHTMKAYDLNDTSSDAPARYAIELNKGAAAQIKTGDVVQIPPTARYSGQ